MFPLIIPSSYPAFSENTLELKVYFEVPKNSSVSMNSATLVCSIVDQKTNKSVLIDGKSQITSSQGYGLSFSQDDKGWYAIIPKSMIEGGWGQGRIYKLQLRYYYRQQYSEWSTICYLKATSSEIALNILNASEGSIIYVSSPIFKGKYSNLDKTEIQARYKFELCNFNGDVIESTGWKGRIDSPHDEVVFNTILENYEHYKVNYYIETKNGYTNNTSYSFYTLLDLLESPNFEVTAENDYNEGRVKIKIKNSDAPLTSNLVLRRTDSKSNFKIWEDYKYFYALDEYVDISFDDFLVENNITYKYGIQLVSQEGFRGKLIESNFVFVTYEDIFIFENGKQLKVKYNPKISSWKRQLQETKTETIGSKYPFIRRNGEVNYFTFPISGLISYKTDEQSLLYDFGGSGLYDINTKEISFHEAFDTYINLDNLNISSERIFRETAEEFLTNGNYKYFKSPTEGVKIISIMNVSLTPNDTVGRMLYSFSCTANEIADPSLNSALNCRIIDMGNYMALSELGGKEYFISLSLNTTQNQDLFELIRQQIENQSDSSSYAKVLDHLTYLRIEIDNLSIIANSGYTIKIQQEKNGAFQDIKISKELGIYELNNVIKIYGLKASTAGANLSIYCKVYCTFESKIKAIIPQIGTTGIQKFYQIYENFSSISSSYQGIDPMDIFSRIFYKENLNNSNILSIQSFTYMRVDATPGTRFLINGEEKTTDDNGIWEVRNAKITSAKMITEGMASITVVYNGIAYVS